MVLYFAGNYFFYKKISTQIFGFNEFYLLIVNKYYGESKCWNCTDEPHFEY